jgi:hypothetical protein
VHARQNNSISTITVLTVVMVFFVGIAPHKEARTQQTLRKYALARETFEPQLYEENTEG